MKSDVQWKFSVFVVSLSLCIGRAAPPSQATFAHDIAPIIYKTCAPCHRPGETAPFPLLSYRDVKTHGRQIADVTGRRYMPPWPPQPNGSFPNQGHLKDERRLTDSQIRIIADWVREGAPEGDPAMEPPPPQFATEWQLGAPDLVMEAARLFVMGASGPDVFWNFIFAPDVQSTRFVRAVEIRMRTAGNVHHANILLDRMASARRLEIVAGSGFPGMDVNIDRNPSDPESHFIFWKPGSIPYSEPDGFSWRLEPGNVLILNTHLQPTGKSEAVRPTIGLYFTDKAPTRFPLLLELEHDEAINIPPGARDFLVSDDFRMPVDSDVLAIYPHAHYLGKLLEAYATLPDRSRKWLIRIPDWDLNWQAVYRYCEPVFLPAGSIISMRFHYDNSRANPRNPNSPPKRVRAGNEARDEMGHLWLQVLPRGRGDRRRGLQEALLRHRLERNPNDFAAHLNLGAVLLSRLDTQGAVTMLEAAVRIDPTRPEGQDMLGSALSGVGRSQEALRHFQLAVKADPEYMNARYDLAGALAKSGKYGEAVEQFRYVVAKFPEAGSIERRFGELLELAGQTAEADAAYAKAAGEGKQK